MPRVRLPQLSGGEVLPLPHLRWGGDPRAEALASGTRALLVRYSDRKEEPFGTPEDVGRWVAEHRAVTAEVFGYLAGARPLVRARVAEWAGSTFEALSAHGEHEDDPFRGLLGLVDPPAWLPSLAAWPSAMGVAVARAEHDLGWRRRRRSADLRTWAALVGLAALWARESFAAVRPALASAARPGDGDPLLAGGGLLVSQRAVVGAYRAWRRSRP